MVIISFTVCVEPGPCREVDIGWMGEQSKRYSRSATPNMW